MNVDVSRTQNFLSVHSNFKFLPQKNGVVPLCGTTPCSIETTRCSYLPPKVKFTPAKYLKLFWLPV